MNDTAAQIVEAALDRVRRDAVRPLATYRLQFGSHLKFSDAAKLVDYLDALGITHLYASPILKARVQSGHGYDVCDHNIIMPEIGGTAGFAELSEVLRRQGMRLIVDFVPNHMAATPENPWWNDVLENGPNSPFSGYFDIDWLPVKDELENKVLLPILGAQYGEVLESGQLQLEHREGSFFLRYFDLLLPLGPKTSIPLLTHRLDELKAALGETSEALIELQSVLTALDHLPAQTATSPEAVVERQREKEVIKRRLRDLEAAVPEVAAFVAANIHEFNGQAGSPETFDRLDAILNEQPYRVCHWRAASDEINYRRFFDINELAALCMEKPEVFHRSHRLVGDLFGTGELHGLRIDHIDGLYAPESYLWRLQWCYLAAVARRAFDTLVAPASSPADGQSPASGAAAHPAETTRLAGDWREFGPLVLNELCAGLGLPSPAAIDQIAVFGADCVPPAIAADAPPPTGAPAFTSSALLPLFVVVEKILGPDEPLPDSWPAAGTTGYDSLNTINGLFINPRGWRELERFYRRFSGTNAPFGEIVHECKRLILRVAMASELQLLAHRLNRISEQHRRSRDFTLNMLRYALREILSCFPVYRTYPGPAGISDRDRRFVRQAVADARRRNPATEPSTFDFIREVLLLEHPPGLSADAIQAREDFSGRFQQVTSPVMAKGVEDTAFYLYFPLSSVNDVGGDPRAAVRLATDFHRENLARQRRGVYGLLSSTTHDTKRTEDVRARINVLSEIPEAWSAAVRRWARLNRKLTTQIEGQPAPCRNDEYLFYQTLIGIWPLDPGDDQAREQVLPRMQQYMQKAIREAKQFTSWISPNRAYEEVVEHFVQKSLERRPKNRFLDDFIAFQARLVDAGLYAGLSQLTLKLLSPGIPDIYQGQECWDFSLVDPDNRRPVDFSQRQHLLEELRLAAEAGALPWQALVATLARTPRDPRSKLMVTWKSLQLRKKHALLFHEGEYVPVAVSGPKSEHVIAFRWRPRTNAAAPGNLLVVVPRWVSRPLMDLADPAERTAMWREFWNETHLLVDADAPRLYQNVFTERPVQVDQDRLDLKNLLIDFPVAVLESA